MKKQITIVEMAVCILTAVLGLWLGAVINGSFSHLSDKIFYTSMGMLVLFFIWGKRVD